MTHSITTQALEAFRSAPVAAARQRALLECLTAAGLRALGLMAAAAGEPAWWGGARLLGGGALAAGALALSAVCLRRLWILPRRQARNPVWVATQPEAALSALTGRLRNATELATTLAAQDAPADTAAYKALYLARPTPQASGLQARVAVAIWQRPGRRRRQLAARLASGASVRAGWARAIAPPPPPWAQALRLVSHYPAYLGWPDLTDEVANSHIVAAVARILGDLQLARLAATLLNR